MVHQVLPGHRVHLDHQVPQALQDLLALLVILEAWWVWLASLAVVLLSWAHLVLPAHPVLLGHLGLLDLRVLPDLQAPLDLLAVQAFSLAWSLV